MAKVLISFLGTGSLNRTPNNQFANSSDRQYRTAKYHFSNNEESEHTFVAAALAEHNNIDKIILIGTVHSMWEEVYRYFSEKNDKTFDEDVYFQILEHCENATHRSELTIPHIELIEQSIGSKAKIILIKYGINDEETQENINTVLGIEQELNEKDEVIVDITHSFRSLPILIMNLLIYLQTVSKKKINISHVYYGMLEVNRELGHAPVAELSSMLDISKWITGAYAFENFGNAYQIADLIESENKDVSECLRRFSNLMNLNHLGLLKSEINSLKAIRNTTYRTLIPSLIITPIVNRFIAQFENIRTLSLFQLRLAKWQFEHHNYTAAYISVIESIITYTCEINNKDWQKREIREEAKDALRKQNNTWRVQGELTNIFRETNHIRNSLAHSIETDTRLNDMIKILKENLSALSNIIKQ